MIDFKVRKLIDLNSPSYRILAAADTDSSIHCMGIEMGKYYRSQRLVRRARDPLTVRTGNEALQIKEYVNLIVMTDDGRELHRSFWILDLPSFDFLISNTLIHLLGYELTNQLVSYTHESKDLDWGDELEMLDCSMYPLEAMEGSPDLFNKKVNLHNIFG